MKISPIPTIALALACLLSSAGCGGTNPTATTKTPEEIKKQYIDRAAREQQDNAQKK